MKNNVPTTRVSIIGRIAAIFLLLLVQGCTDARYYLQSVTGQLDVLQRRQAIDTLLADKNLDEELRQHLELVQSIRSFALEDLKLPDSGSYTGYSDLERNYVVKNLVAAPEFSTQLQSWCYPVIGCATYRGYFDQEMLTKFEQKMVGQGFDTYVASVPAYSTLGWFDDPVLNTVLDWPDHKLAGLIFHELAHQKVYVEDDTTFNESFATAIEQIGVALWIENTNHAVTVTEYKEAIERKDAVLQLIQETHEKLDVLYNEDNTDTQMRKSKQTIFDALRKDYTTMRETLDSDPGFDHWMSTDLNNAKLGSTLSYHSQVDGFTKLFGMLSADFERFYQRVEMLSLQPQEKRNESLIQCYMQELDC